MARTKITGFLKNHSCVGGYMYRNKRKRVKIDLRHTHHALRNQNRFSNELSFTNFKQSQQRLLYSCRKRDQEKTALIHLSELQVDEKIQDSSRKVLQDKMRSLKRQNKQVNNFIDVCKEERDMYKMIRRRGSLKPFMGHRDRRQLYKRQLIYWV